jgi:hypothetical protein
LGRSIPSAPLVRLGWIVAELGRKQPQNGHSLSRARVDRDSDSVSEALTNATPASNCVLVIYRPGLGASAVQPQVVGNVASSSMEIVGRHLRTVNPGVVSEYLLKLERDSRLTEQERAAVHGARKELEAQATRRP